MVKVNKCGDIATRYIDAQYYTELYLFAANRELSVKNAEIQELRRKLKNMEEISI